MGAQLAAPDRPCISVCGDGGFSMTPYVVATAVEYDLPCIWVVWNNFSWAAIRDIQVGMFDNRQLGTYFEKDKKPYNPDFAAWARACGADGGRSEERRPRSGAAAGDPQQASVSVDVHVDAEVVRLPREVAAAPDTLQRAGLR